MSDRLFPPDTEAYLNAGKAQAEAADPNHSAWVAANAGSGKTKVLIDRVARLLLRQAPPDSLLCVTYTKAAANEMLARLYDRLGAWSIMASGKLREKLAELEGRVPGSYPEEEVSAARSLFARALETPGGLRIETIHAFCSRILRRFPLEAGAPPGFQEMEETDAAELWRAACREVLLDTDPAIQSALDVLSEVGGYTGALGALSALKPYRLAAQQFAASCSNDTEALARTLRDALNAPEQTTDALLSDGMGKAFPREDLRACLVILSAGAKTDQATAQLIEAALNETEPAQRWTLYQRIFKTGTGDWRKSNPYTKTSADTPLIPRLFQMKDGEGEEVTRVRVLDAALTARAAYDRTLALLTAGLPALSAYQRLKRARAALDFDDLIEHTRALLVEAAASPWVLYKLDGGLTHVLLDEAQDTSPDQWALLNALTEEFFAGQGAERRQDPRTQFVVGDEKQSIFSFQGADPQRFLDERRDFEARAREATGKTVLPDMAMSFRSCPEVLGFVDKTFEMAAMDGPAFTLDPVSAADIARHTARRANQPGRVELWPINVPAEDEDANPWHAPLDQLSGQNPKNMLARQVAKSAKDMVERGDLIWEENPDRSWSRRPVRAGDILILVQNRTGGLFDALIAELKSAGLPVAGADRLVLTEHIGVQDCLNLIRFVLLPEDDLALAEILRSPIGGLTEDNRHLFPLAYGREKGESLWSRLLASTDPAHAPIRSYLQALLEQAHLPAFEFLTTALEEVRIEGRTGWDRLMARLGSPARDPIRALLDRALAFDATGPASLQGFLATMERDATQIKRDLAAPGGEVRIMTAHGAKGLQAPVVILPDTTRAPKGAGGEVFMLEKAPVWSPSKALDTPAIADAREIAQARAKAEHRRLLYVALTRAQDRLIICGHWQGARPRPEDKTQKTGYPKASWYDLCQSALSALVGEADGEARVFGAGAIAGGKAADATPLPPQRPDWLDQPAPIAARRTKLVAPSSIVADDRAVLSPFGPRRAARLKRGRLIHALLQRLPDIAKDRRREAALAFLSRDEELDEAARQEMITAAFGVLDHPDFTDVFAPGGRAEAPIVGTAPELPDGTIVNGRIDRLRVTVTDVLVVDFKTDQPAPARVEDIAPTYLAQMGAYAAVLRQSWPGRAVRAALVWTDGPRLMYLPDDLIEKALLRSSQTV